MTRAKRKSYPVTGPCRSCGKSTSPDPDNDLRGLFWGMEPGKVGSAWPIIYCEPCLDQMGLDQMVAELPDRTEKSA